MKMLKYILAKLLLKIQRPAIYKSAIDKTSKICPKSHIYRCEIAAYSYVGNDCTIINTNVGKYCSIADGCFIGGARHPMEYISTSPVFHEGRNIMKKNFACHRDPKAEGVVIGNDVWIGSNSLIKDGVEIGTGAVIAMGSVLTHSVPSYEIWGGNPARKIRDRFSQPIKEKLLESEWWEFTEKQLMEAAQYFNNPELFIEYISGELK